MFIKNLENTNMGQATYSTTAKGIDKFRKELEALIRQLEGTIYDNK